MNRHLITSLVALTLPLGAAVAQQRPSAAATQQAQPMMMTEVDTRAIKWNPIEVPGFPSGVKIAALAGDPDKAGEPYTLRLRFPDGYAFPAHWHPMAENLTVISGTFYLAMGDKVVEGATKRYVAGDFLNIPGKMSHFGHVAGETVVQLHGTGPFQIMVTGATPTK
jgi:quercetin dioxygenase-like cupin family protein